MAPKALIWKVYPTMVVRITKKKSQERTVLHVDGMLQAADVEVLKHEWVTACGDVTLELSRLRSADSCGVEAIHELVARGAILGGCSPYLELLLNTCRRPTNG
jgi:hypothetical protein